MELQGLELGLELLLLGRNLLDIANQLLDKGQRNRGVRHCGKEKRYRLRQDTCQLKM